MHKGLLGRFFKIIFCMPSKPGAFLEPVLDIAILIALGVTRSISSWLTTVSSILNYLLLTILSLP